MNKAELKKIMDKPDGWAFGEWLEPSTINGIPVEEILNVYNKMC